MEVRLVQKLRVARDRASSRLGRRVEGRKGYADTLSAAASSDSCIQREGPGLCSPALPQVRPVTRREIATAPRPPEARPRGPTPFCDLGFGSCRAFLEGQEGARGLCCGKPVMGGDGKLARSYCAEHHRSFYAIPGPR